MRQLYSDHRHSEKPPGHRKDQSQGVWQSQNLLPESHRRRYRNRRLVKSLSEKAIKEVPKILKMLELSYHLY